MHQSQSKLTPAQIEHLASLIGRGMSLQDAADFCRVEWGIKISKVALHNKAPITQAISDRRKYSRMKAGEALQDTLPSVTETITERMQALKDEAKELTDDVRNCELSDKDYRAKTSRLKDIDSALAAYHKTYQSMLNWIEDETDHERNQKTAQKAPQDYLAELDKMVEMQKDFN